MYTFWQISRHISNSKYVGQKYIVNYPFGRRHTSQLAPAYQPKLVEGNDSEKCYTQPFRPESKSKRGKFRMLLPPPNITGNLHLGHALMATVQDVICRQKRQMGYEILWIPGTDHAGIATQLVVEKKLMKERGVTRHILGQRAFLNEVCKWKREKKKSIMEDLRKLGCTLTWDREYFTMDERQAYAVNEAFIRLFDEGLMKRKESLVNWSCALESAISDMEVETLDVKGPTEVAVPGYEKNITFGRIYDINYTVFGNSNEVITVSTTRPETLLGDVAVAVNPNDERYRKYRDMPEVLFWHPFRKEPIPLVFDVTVNPEFGTGAVKITPAHDRNDFELASRHLLKPRQVFTNSGLIKKEHSEFANLPRFVARGKILDKLGELQLLKSIRDHVMQLPICSRSGDVIEYMLRKQWFLHCEAMAMNAMSEVSSGRLQIIPENFQTEWKYWLQNCRDWCVSRQIWWGHQIPAYKAVDTLRNKSIWVAAHSEKEALNKAQNKLNSTSVTITQDPDVLDTWFSSALLPFSASNWPSEEYKKDYPLDVMETGHDILFFWVARMVMLGLKLTGSAPFKKILLNGIVCDAYGRKMSKSLGNIVSAQQIVQGASLESMQKEIKSSHKAGILSAGELEKSLKGLKRMFPQGIPACGTDALRFTLCSHNIKSHFIKFDVNECHTNKLFFNKIWQAMRFTLGAAKLLKISLNEIESMNNVPLTKWDKWILSCLADTLNIYYNSFENYNFHAATSALKKFLYNHLCDAYLETCKTNIHLQNSEGYVHCATLATVLSWSLQAMSPFTPFLSKELLKHIPQNITLDLNKFRDSGLEQEINDILNICQTVRQINSRHQISKKYDPQLTLFAHNKDALQILKNHEQEIKALTLVRGVHSKMLNKHAKKNEDLKLFSTAGHLCSFGIATNDLYKLNNNQILTSANINGKKLQKLEDELKRYQLRMENGGFRKFASAEVQKQHAVKIQQLAVEIEKIKSL